MNLVLSFVAVSGAALISCATWILAVANGNSRMAAAAWAASPLIVLYGAFYFSLMTGAESRYWVGMICFAWLGLANFWQAAKIRGAMAGKRSGDAP
jgi:hypothetical protein